MAKIKYAIIGCGRIAPNHIAAIINNSEKFEICAVCDISSKNIVKLLSSFNLDGKVKTYTDYKEMIASEKPQLVAIATDSGSHAEIALNCLNAGCNLIIEKPIAMSISDADMLIKAAKDNNVKLCACHQNRFNKSVQKIREAIEQGRFGKLFHGAANIRWNRAEDYYTQAPWRGKWQSDGGALMNQCIHNIDLLRWMMGDEITEVMAYTDNLNHSFIEAEDIGLALIKFKNGSYGIIEGTTNIYPTNLEETLYIFGEKGTIKAGGKSVNIIEEWRFADEIGDVDEIKQEFCENPPNVYGYGHTPLYADMADAITNDRPPYVDGEAGKRALELVLAIYKSAAEGKPVKLPLIECATIDFTGRFK
jgi:UDP-N-acetyl-2-amino-2-deoxyglucuronate dehydrogenase